ncbi:MAG: ornithine cyclodeaminase family protein [Rhodocyclaceae bacterium]|jgi:ornithine cyclodeaminase|nr:ornithine cyclodeaminase family protein [Rhodocyclaceae bacterium]
MTIYLTEADVRRLLTMELALEAVEAAHRAHALGRAIDIPRQRTRVPTASLHILQGALLDENVIGYKAYTASKAGARFLVHLFDAADGRPLAVIEADFLGMMRTGAAGGIAAKVLSRPDASVVGMIGAGWQAQGQLEALCKVRLIRQVKLFSRHAERCRLASADFSSRFGVEVVPVASAEAAVQGSDIVVTITTSATPVVQGDWLAPGTHINAAGSNALIRRELDEKVVGRASLICVDSRETALREAGDLLPALEKGRLHAGQLVELGEIVTGIRPGRVDAQAITLFESQGMAIQDLALARRLMTLAQARGIGMPLPY